MKFLTKLVLGAIAAAASGVAVNKVVSNKESEMIEGLYGRYVEVFGKRICVEVRGEGSETIVLYPGFGDVSPVLNFRPLASFLSHYYRVVTVEPFGYGISDSTSRERSVENIAEELHETMKALDIDSYVLAAHSFGGVYALELMNSYPGEVKAFIGIDTTVPEAMKYLDDSLVEYALGSGIRFLNESGINRLLLAFNEERFLPENEYYQYTNAEKKMFNILTLNRSFTDNMKDEMLLAKENLDKILTKAIPDEVPAYQFVSLHNDRLLESLGAPEDTWTHYHEILTNNPKSKLERHAAPHELHQKITKEMAINIDEWLRSL